MSGATKQKSAKRKAQIVGGMVALAVAGGAIFLGQGESPVSLPWDSFDGGSSSSVNTVAVTGTIGSEKAAFFKDPKVVETLEEKGLSVQFLTAGSRDIVKNAAAGRDFLFPSSAPAGQAASAAREGSTLSTPFYSPMVVLTHADLVPALKGAGLVTERDGFFYLNTARLIEITAEGKRWRDIAPEFPSPRAVEVTTTDVRTSNSAAMYAAVLGWVANGENPFVGPDQAREAAKRIAPLFAGQGYTQSSSAGPFERFIRVDKGEMPMVLAYEAQYIEYARTNPNNARHQVLYLDPTINSEHSLVALTDQGRKLADALATPELQRLAAEHGFRPSELGALDDRFYGPQPAVPRELMTIPQPTNDQLEALISALEEQGL